MKTRIISASAAIVLLVAIVCLGQVAVGLAVFVLAVIGMHELNAAFAKGGFRPIPALGYVSCLPLLYIALADVLPEHMLFLAGTDPLLAAAAGLFALLTALFCFVLFSDGKYTFRDIAVTLFGIVYIVFLFSFVTLTRNMEKGYLYIWLVFIGAWVTDTFAYFTGVAVGKTKILPRISPKKSVEGSIGGVAGCVLAMLLFGRFAVGMQDVPAFHFAILGLICGVISQIGDWSASAVKRAVGIKDFGNIMPGHGGVLDRLDSILFTAPAVYFYISLFFRGV